MAKTELMSDKFIEEFLKSHLNSQILILILGTISSVINAIAKFYK